MSTQNELPDWLRELRDQQAGEEFQTDESGTYPEQAAPPAPMGEFDELREKATAELPVEEPPVRKIPVISDLSPFQRFVLALMLFLNVSVLGCLFLLVAEKIALVR